MLWLPSLPAAAAALLSLLATASSQPQHPPTFLFPAANPKSPNQGLCQDGPTIKRGHQIPLNPPVCPLSISPLWFICGFYPYELAADVCAAYGWRLAMLTEENGADVAQVMSGCGYSDAWVAGAYGLPGDPCAVAFANEDGTAAGALLNLSTGQCAPVPRGVVCEEIPQVTVTQTETINALTIPFGQSSTTTTALRTLTVRPYKPVCHDCGSSSDSSSSSSGCSSSSGETWHSDSSSSDDCGCHHKGNIKSKPKKEDKPGKKQDKDKSKEPKQEKQEEPQQQQDPLEKGEKRHKPSTTTTAICYTPTCLPVCPTSISSLHYLPSASLNNTQQAAAECAKYGWSLLDFTDGQSSTVRQLVQACRTDPLALFDYLLINSYNGVSAGCPILQVLNSASFEIVIAGLGGSGFWCDTPLRQYNVICQEACPFKVAASGVEPGQLSITTTLTVATATLFTPTTTQTVTESCTETVFIH
jgi:hypothetical protein